MAAAASLRGLQSSPHFFNGTPRRRPLPAHAALEQALRRTPLCGVSRNFTSTHETVFRRSPLVEKAPPLILKEPNAVSQFTRESLNHTHRRSRKVQTCVASASAGAAVANDFQYPGSQPAITHALSDELPVRLPPPPSDSSILSIFPYLWRLATADKSLRWRVALSLILLVGGKAAGLAGPVLFKRGMDVLSESSKAQGYSQATMYAAVSALVLSGVSKGISGICNEARYTVFSPVGQATGRRVAMHFFDHILHLDMAFHLERKTGALSTIMERGKRSVTMIFRAIVFTLVPTVVELVLVCGLLAKQVSTAFAGVVLLTFAAYVAWTVALTKASMASRKEVNNLNNLTSGKVVDALLNYETVAQFNNQALEEKQYDSLLKDYQDASINLEYLSASLNSGQALILATGVSAIMAMAGTGVIQGRMTVGDLVLANGLILQLSVPLQFLGFLYRELRTSLVDMESMFNTLSRKSALPDGSRELKRSQEGASVTAKDLKFGYSDARQVLKGVSFSIKPGQSVAIVGPSGSGKSTIVRLLLRMYDPQHGSMAIDGVDVRDLTQESLRSAVAVVPQDTVLFNDTIFYNIAYGRPTASKDDIITAAKMAKLHDAIMRMPDGYETLVGERGLKLSGGEKQRVAIARAFLKSPRMLCCDEATSALDSGTEAAILDSLKELAAGRTCLFVAHRLSTVAHCDHILVMDAGLIVEEGTHEELVQKGGAYSKMWSLQQAEKKEDAPENGHNGANGAASVSGRGLESEGLASSSREDSAHVNNGTNGANGVERSLASRELKEEMQRSEEVGVVVEESAKTGTAGFRVDDLLPATRSESE
ncbi:mitochondrial ABC transporter ATM [Klebsormidium nitens]|uniref:Mitochondrial ABC transporter ATM n=1 Tax=Klebsormidium nitens TaxID=105231 RepID=A0A1Y1HU27_KLENI|nr:mitochondrial ABC transporter ATM [Klebsormidium nitens]|eukprot:GAQ82134.1 mitochondrial ABC transporter ATM [Klebsormidium nitens]